VGNKTNLV